MKSTVYPHRMGAFSAMCVVIANMIGTGVFTSLGFQLMDIKDPFAILMLWFVGAVLALCGALVYGELGSAMPRSGGEYHYLSKIYHPAVGFMSGWVSITVGFAAPVALACMAFGSYLSRILTVFSPQGMAVCILVLTTVIHCLGFRIGVFFQDAFTIFKIVLILVFVLLGFLLVNHPIRLSFSPTPSSLPSVFGSAFAVSLVYGSYSYSGWNASTYIASELDQPQKKLPISLWMGTIIVAVLYVLLNATFLKTAPISEMAGQVDVAFIPARYIFGTLGGKLLSLMIAVLLVSSVSSMVFVGPRVTQVMGEDMRLFRFFSQKSGKVIPVYAILFQSAISLILILSSTFERVLMYVGFTLNLFTLLTVFGVFIHRRRYPDAVRPYKTWGYPIVPVVFIVFICWMQVFLLLKRPGPAFCGLATALSGLVCYFIDSAMKKSRRSDRSGKD
jgi:APA family basic amino acid/polyamine antiporter